MSFKNHFSELAETYAQHRPRYPKELFAHLASIAPGRRLAWDTGTGNGQAAVDLAAHFNRVIATDASEEQIESRLEHPAVEYRVEPAEKTSIEERSIDLTTASVAVHWFDLDHFYREVKRVSRPGAILAVWTYFFLSVSPEVDELIEEFYYETLAGHWSERLRYVEQGYENLPFPFEELEPPAFQIKAQWTLMNLQGFILSWSGTSSFMEQEGQKPVAEFLGRLAQAWGEEEMRRQVEWVLFMRVGRVKEAA